ncbi:HECT-domain-containing protein [Anaeromyces robustus]|uniref:HECT-type E3 ubiquitin transferase n=1 Tax=Anaeromyces robustus TaxID=1754192 RepID=A0A1Y1W2Y0_9FUNG|nr:HECT-domain-containing protein [Anaeromyces robustus]|eukprot:ORX67732.1 HECT-domain-containing protein [Anaeromyces robustus]
MVNCYIEGNITGDKIINEIVPEYKFIYERKVQKFKYSIDENDIDNDNDDDGYLFNSYNFGLNSYNFGHYGENRLEINRNNIFDDAYSFIMNKTPSELKKRLKIKYIGESGLDAGGLLRDFFYQISKVIGDPNYSFFKYINDKNYELNINPESGIVEENHLRYFRFIGRIMGLALRQHQYLPIEFSYIFYKQLLNKTLCFKDLIFIDFDLYKQLNWLKDNEVEGLSLTFRIDEKDCFDNQSYVELIPNGSNIAVTDENKNEYINLVIQYKLDNTNVMDQFDALRKGFYELIPPTLISTFNEFDLKFLLTGNNEIDIEDWQNNTDYEGYHENDITVTYFWIWVSELSKEDRVKLLVFATGNSQIPITGFKDLQGNGHIQHFKLKKAGDIDSLPISHTCFNRIDLPPYKSYEQLNKKLLLAISDGNNEFTLE